MTQRSKRPGRTSQLIMIPCLQPCLPVRFGYCIFPVVLGIRKDSVIRVLYQETQLRSHTAETYAVVLYRNNGIGTSSLTAAISCDSAILEYIPLVYFQRQVF